MSTKKIFIPDSLSPRAKYLTLYFNETELASATGFFYSDDGKTYLVTNWHNLAGRDSFTGDVLASHGGVPNSVGINIGRIVDKDGSGVQHMEIRWLKTPLVDTDGSPLWFEHPIHGSKIDVAVLEIEMPVDHVSLPINDHAFTEIRPEVSHDVFILGFPLGLIGTRYLPIWKRATIATEPTAEIDGLPQFLVDTATRKGMSGSPVFLRYRGFHISDPTIGIQDTDWMGEGTDFVGIYSGRLGADEFKAQLGIVWHKEVIVETIVGKRIATT